jgi:hypothetical protein
MHADRYHVNFQQLLYCLNGQSLKTISSNGTNERLHPEVGATAQLLVEPQILGYLLYTRSQTRDHM